VSGALHTGVAGMVKTSVSFADDDIQILLLADLM